MKWRKISLYSDVTLVRQTLTMLCYQMFKSHIHSHTHTHTLTNKPYKHTARTHAQIHNRWEYKMCSQQYRRVHTLIWRRIANFVVCIFFSLSGFFYCSIIDSVLAVMMMMMMLNGTISVSPFLVIAVFRLCSHLPFFELSTLRFYCQKALRHNCKLFFFLSFSWRLNCQNVWTVW